MTKIHKPSEEMQRLLKTANFTGATENRKNSPMPYF